MVAAHYKKDDVLPSSDISGYGADFHEGHGTVGAGQGRGMAWQGNGMLCVNRPECFASRSLKLYIPPLPVRTNRCTIVRCSHTVYYRISCELTIIAVNIINQLAIFDNQH